MQSWKVIAASVRGTSHERIGQECQDAHCWQQMAGDFLVAAVADGAGSAELGELGARVAASRAVPAITGGVEIGRFEDDGYLQALLRDALKTSLAAVIAEAASRDVQARELATTLIILIATPALVASAQIGDGAAVVGSRDGNLVGLTVPQTGQYANETTFLVSPNALESAQVAIWRGQVANVAVLSDGLQRLCLKMPAGTPHDGFFSPLFDFMARAKDQSKPEEELASFLSSRRITERTDDDLTLLLGALPS